MAIGRRQFISALGGATVAWPLTARAQQPRKMPLIGVLISASPPHPFADAVQRGLLALGYSEGQNIAVEYRYTKGRSDLAQEFAEEFVRLGVDVIVAHYAVAVEAAMAATRTIPIVMAPHGAPLQLGAIASLSRPGGNVTGLSAMDAEIGGKRVQLLRELIPNIARIAVLATTPTTSSYSGPFVEDLRLAATRAGLQLEPILIGGPSELQSAFAAMAKAEAQAVVVQAFFDPHYASLIEFAAKYRLPYMSGSRDVVAAEGLISLSANWLELYARAAFYVDKILKGARPAGSGGDPVPLGLVASLARPGGNATGINFFLNEVVAKRLRLLHDLVPKAARIAVLVNPTSAPFALRDVQEAAAAVGLQIQILNATTIGEIDAAFATFARERPDALFVAPDGFFTSRAVQFATLTARDKIPAAYSNREIVAVGGLMSYGTDVAEAFRQVGVYTGKILKGAKPADLPVLQSTKFEFVINLQTARALGIEVPSALLSIADEVIE